MKLDVIIFERSEKCDICNSNNWYGHNQNAYEWRVFMIAGTHAHNKLIYLEHKNKKYLIGVKSNETRFCMRCFETLVGLESYYDAFFPEFLNNRDCKMIIKKLYSNLKLLDEAMDIRSNGKLFPKSFVEKIKCQK